MRGLQKNRGMGIVLWEELSKEWCAIPKFNKWTQSGAGFLMKNYEQLLSDLAEACGTGSRINLPLLRFSCRLQPSETRHCNGNIQILFIQINVQQSIWTTQKKIIQCHSPSRVFASNFVGWTPSHLNTPFITSKRHTWTSLWKFPAYSNYFQHQYVFSTGCL